MSGTLRFPSTVRFSSFHKSKIQAAAATVDTRKPANLYQVLRIKETASPIEIKTAYRNLAKRFHPDTGSDGRDFMAIHEAYATLSDPTARALYDRSMGAGRRLQFSSANRFQSRRWETDQCW